MLNDFGIKDVLYAGGALVAMAGSFFGLRAATRLNARDVISINQRVKTLEEKQEQTMISNTTRDERIASNGRLSRDNKEANSKMAQALTDFVNTLPVAYVPRIEHERENEHMDRRFNQLGERLDDLKKSIDNLTETVIKRDR